MGRRVPQLDDDVVLTLTLPPETEEWADELIGEVGPYDVTRTPDALTVAHHIGGNCNAITNALMFLADVEAALVDGEVDPMTFTLRAVSQPRERGGS